MTQTQKKAFVPTDGAAAASWFSPVFLLLGCLWNASSSRRPGSPSAPPSVGASAAMLRLGDLLLLLLPLQQRDRQVPPTDPQLEITALLSSLLTHSLKIKPSALLHLLLHSLIAAASFFTVKASWQLFTGELQCVVWSAGGAWGC